MIHIDVQLRMRLPGSDWYDVATGDLDAPDIERLAAEMVTALRKLADQAPDEMRKAVLANLGQAADQHGSGLAEVDLVVCHCMCGLHRDVGALCQRMRPGQQHVLPIIAAEVEAGRTQVPMCKPCAGWWWLNRPGRIART